MSNDNNQTDGDAQNDEYYNDIFADEQSHNHADGNSHGTNLGPMDNREHAHDDAQNETNIADAYIGDTENYALADCPECDGTMQLKGRVDKESGAMVYFRCPDCDTTADATFDDDSGTYTLGDIADETPVGEWSEPDENGVQHKTHEDGSVSSKTSFKHGEYADAAERMKKSGVDHGPQDDDAIEEAQELSSEKTRDEEPEGFVLATENGPVFKSKNANDAAVRKAIEAAERGEERNERIASKAKEYGTNLAVYTFWFSIGVLIAKTIEAAHNYVTRDEQ